MTPAARVGRGRGAEGGLSALVQRARQLTRGKVPLLLEGETGVGKELLARTIHAALHAHAEADEAPFVALSCGGLPRDLLASELFGNVQGALPGSSASKRGALERASGGTLFLDEIGELPSDLRSYLLRVIESGEFFPLGGTVSRRTRFRLIVGSSRELRAAAEQALFRKDLLFRISVASLQVPPLRARLVDLPLLLQHFVAETCARHQLTPKRLLPAALEALRAYAWPGNVRELRNLVEVLCLVAETDTIDLSMLPARSVSRWAPARQAP